MSKNQPVNELGEKGLILFTSSTMAEEATRGLGAYGSSKGALNGLLLPMARDLGKFNIRVVAISPSLMRTNMSTKSGEPPKEIIERMSPLGRVGAPEDFAHMAQVVIENSYINGVRLRLDGGMVASHV